MQHVERQQPELGTGSALQEQHAIAPGIDSSVRKSASTSSISPLKAALVKGCSSIEEPEPRQSGISSRICVSTSAGSIAGPAAKL